MSDGRSDEFERRDVGRTDHREMCSVDRRDTDGLQPFSDRDEARIGATEWEIAVLIDELSHASPVVGRQGLDLEAAVENGVIQRNLGVRAKFPVEEVGGFCDHHRGGDERPRIRVEEVAVLRVVSIIAICCCDQRPGVDDQHSSALAKAVGEEFIDLVTDPVAACADPDERELRLFARSVEDVTAEEFGCEFVRRRPACSSGGCELPSELVRHVERGRHGRSIRDPFVALSIVGRRALWRYEVASGFSMA